MSQANVEFKKQLLNRTFSFSVNLTHLISSFPKNEVLKVINDQLLRSGLSIGANLAEGQGSSSKNEFKNFIHYAYKSSIETRYWLAIIEKTNYNLNRELLMQLMTENKEINKILSSILLTLKGKKTLNS